MPACPACLPSLYSPTCLETASRGGGSVPPPEGQLVWGFQRKLKQVSPPGPGPRRPHPDPHRPAWNPDVPPGAGPADAGAVGALPEAAGHPRAEGGVWVGVPGAVAGICGIVASAWGRERVPCSFRQLHLR